MHVNFGSLLGKQESLDQVRYKLKVHKRVHYSKRLSYNYRGAKCYPISNKITKPSFKSWLFLLYNSFFFFLTIWKLELNSQKHKHIT